MYGILIHTGAEETNAIWMAATKINLAQHFVVIEILISMPSRKFTK